MADSPIAHPLTLKCGLTLPNRLVKAAMAENMADGQALPPENMNLSYEHWAKGGWGVILTGNVQVDQKYLGSPADVALNKDIEYSQMLDAWKTWADTCQSHGTPTIVQISHPGRQSPRGTGTRPFYEQGIAPSAIALNFGDGYIARAASFVGFGTPKEMSENDVKQLIRQFADTASLAAKAGFSGVELHGAHGYLLARFLSESANTRTDEYGGSPRARAKLVVDIIRAIRAEVPSTFCIGIKLNSVDHQSPAAFEACLEQINLIAAEGLDFMEISGGTYERPTLHRGCATSGAHVAAPAKTHRLCTVLTPEQMMMGVDGEAEAKKTNRTKVREAFFLEFAESIRHRFPGVPLLVTGGFRSRAAMNAAIEDQHCDLIGLARPAVVNPQCAKTILLNSELEESEARVEAPTVQPSWLMRISGVKAVGAGAQTLWYRERISKMSGL